MESKEKMRVRQLLNNKSFDDMVQILDGMPAKNAAQVHVRSMIMEVMEEKYPKEFEKWL